MLQLREFGETLLTHLLTPAGPIPTLCDPDGVYPYPTFVETSHRPVLNRYRMVTLENDYLSVTVCPDLGGKVWSMLDKTSGRPVLFVPESVLPVRILPRLAFIAGGIEVSFPMSHTPVQLEPVHCRTELVRNRLYVWCGERELHSGMQWTVEYSLGAADRFLTQRTCFHNPGADPQPWMSWSNAAVPARADTEFHFPDGPVLAHGDEVRTIDWAREGPRRLDEIKRMMGYFWLEANGGSCGVFTPSLGQGLYHLANRKIAPGIKLWSYGVGPDERWGKAASLSGQGYVELQGGPIRDQSIRHTLFPGATHSHAEFWLPSSVPLDVAKLRTPSPRLLALAGIPWFEWPPTPSVRYWTSVLAAYQQRDNSILPSPPSLNDHVWAPRPMTALGDALEWAASVVASPAKDAWLVQLGAWLAGGGQIDAALQRLQASADDCGRALAARLLFRARKDPHAAATQMRSIVCRALALHPQIVVERDVILQAMGPQALPEREQWLARVQNTSDEWVRERMAALLLDQGKAEEARSLLEQTRFQLVHQRYARTELWNRIVSALHLEKAPVPWLGEDDLAAFGAYRQTDS